MDLPARADWRDWRPPHGATSPAELERYLRTTDLARQRERRIFWLLIGVWIVNLFDLGFSLLARQQRVLVELNPVAARLFDHGPIAVTAYKLTLVVLGTGILWRYRRHRISETAAWICAIFCVALSLLWHKLYLDVQPLWVELNLINEILPNEVTVISRLGSALP